MHTFQNVAYKRRRRNFAPVLETWQVSFNYGWVQAVSPRPNMTAVHKTGLVPYIGFNAV